MDMIDRVLMTVNPGFGGQKFIDPMLEKIKQIRNKLDSYPNSNHIRLEVDGGVNTNNIKLLADSGVDTFVAGSAIFGNGENGSYDKIISQLREALKG